MVLQLALISNPEVLIADEPTTALDVTIQAQILELMKKLRTEYSTATIMITHNLGIVAELCQKVAVMYGGRIIEYGTVKEVFSRSQASVYTGTSWCSSFHQKVREKSVLRQFPDLLRMHRTFLLDVRSIQDAVIAGEIVKIEFLV